LWAPKKPGAYKIEIIPFVVGPAAEKFTLRKYAEVDDLYYERTYWNHRGIGVNNDAFVCAAKNFGQKCPICEHRAQLAQSPKAENEEMVKALSPRERQLFLIVDHDDLGKGVQLWEISYALFGKHLDAKVANADEEDRVRFRRFADPDEGSTLKLMATEESMGRNKFLEFSVDEFRPRKAQLDPDWLDHGFCLDDMVRLVPYAELKKIFLQTGEDDSQDDTRARGTAPRGNTRASEPEPAPARTSRAAPAKNPPSGVNEDRVVQTTSPSANGAPPAFRAGDEVEFDYREKIVTGVVFRHDPVKGIVEVTVAGRERPQVVDDVDVRLLAPEPAPKPRERPAEPEPADEPPARRGRADEDPDPPPRSARRAPADNEDPPATRRPGPAPKKSQDSDWD